jgi:hypothetical protein
MEQNMGILFNISALVLVFAATASINASAEGVHEQAALEGIFDLGFDGLSNGRVFRIYKAHGFAARSVRSGWKVTGDHGNPAPMIGFVVPEERIVTRAVIVTERGKEFSLDSIDICSEATGVGWVFVGSRDGESLYREKGNIPNQWAGLRLSATPTRPLWSTLSK